MKYHLANIDVVLIFAYMFLIIGFGFWVSHRRQKNAKKEGVEGYFLASHKLPWYLIGVSLYASNMSGTSLIGLMGASYKNGIVVYNYEWTAAVILFFFAFLMLPKFLARGIGTIPEYLESRYNLTTKRLFSAFTIFAIIFIDMAGTLYAGGMIIKLLLPETPLWQSIAVLGTIGGIYTIIGGLATVVITEAVQALLLVAGGFLVFGYGLHAVGGWEAFVHKVDAGQWRMIHPSNDPFLPWTGIFGIMLLGFYYWTLNQFIAQRTLGARTLRDGQWGSLFAAFLKMPNMFLMVLPGMLAMVLYPHLESPDLAFPTMVFTLLPDGVRGLVLIALIAAIMSSTNSALNAASSLITLDFIRAWKPKWSDRKLMFTGQVVTTITMIVAITYAPIIAGFPNLFEYVQSVLAYVIPSIVAVYLLGLFSSRITSTAAITVLIVGFFTGITCFVVMRFSVVYREMGLPNIHYTNMAAILFILWIIVAYIISYCGKKPDAAKLDENYAVPEPHADLSLTSPAKAKAKKKPKVKTKAKAKTRTKARVTATAE